MYLEVVFSIELERVLFKYESEHIDEEMGWNRRLVVMEMLVCIAHGSNAFVLRYTCVQARYIHRHQNDVFWDYRILYEVDKVCRLKQTVYK